MEKFSNFWSKNEKFLKMSKNMAKYGIEEKYGKNMAEGPKIWQMPYKYGTIASLQVGMAKIWIKKCEIWP